MTLLEHESLVEALGRAKLGDRLVVMPLLDPERQIGPASIDVRLGTSFRILRRIDEAGLDPNEHAQASVERSQERVTVEFGKPLWLHPGQFVLGSTLEYLKFPSDLAAYVVGRSSWGRVGLLVATAIMVQPGYAGNLTLELVNHGEGPIALYAGSRIAQLAIHSLRSPTEHVYEGKYSGPTGPQVSRLAREHDDIEKLHRVRDILSGIPFSDSASAGGGLDDRDNRLVRCLTLPRSRAGR